jgi:hypothetical protein
MDVMAARCILGPLAVGVVSLAGETRECERCRSKAFVTAWKRQRVDYFCGVIEARASLRLLWPRLRPIQNGRSGTEALTHKVKNTINGCEGTILP